MEPDEPLSSARPTRFLERRIEEKGFRPRFAAAVISTVWIIAIVVFGIVEHLVDPDSFGNVWLGMWWATETVTTVGYGDVVPAQTAGKVIATLLMVGGLSLFAVVTGTITSVFVQRAQAEENRAQRDGFDRKLDELGAELRDLSERLERQDRPDGR